MYFVHYFALSILLGQVLMKVLVPLEYRVYRPHVDCWSFFSGNIIFISLISKQYAMIVSNSTFWWVIWDNDFFFFVDCWNDTGGVLWRILQTHTQIFMYSLPRHVVIVQFILFFFFFCRADAIEWCAFCFCKFTERMFCFLKSCYGTCRLERIRFTGANFNWHFLLALQ